MTPPPAVTDYRPCGQEKKVEGRLQSSSVPLESILLMDGIDLAVGKPKVPHFLLHDQYCTGINYNPSCDKALGTIVYSWTHRPGDLCGAAAGCDSRQGSGGGHSERTGSPPRGERSRYTRDENQSAGWAELQSDLIPSLFGAPQSRKWPLSMSIC